MFHRWIVLSSLPAASTDPLGLKAVLSIVLLPFSTAFSLICAALAAVMAFVDLKPVGLDTLVGAGTSFLAGVPLSSTRPATSARMTSRASGARRRRGLILDGAFVNGCESTSSLR